MGQNEDLLDPLFDGEKPQQEKNILKEQIMMECWKYLYRDPELILDNFIIYVTSEQTYILPPTGNSRIKFLEYMITFFELREEFEKCAHLVKIKEKILSNIKKF